MCEGFFSISPTSEELHQLDEILRDHRPSRRPRPAAKPEPSAFLVALSRAYLLAPENTEAETVLDLMVTKQQLAEGIDDSLLDKLSDELRKEGLL